MRKAFQGIIKFFKFKIFRSAILWTIISGALTSLTLYSDKLFWLAWISVLPLCYFLIKHGGSILKCYLLVLLWALAYYFILYTWFFALHPLTIMGFTEEESVKAVVIIWFSISFAQSLQMSLMGLAYGLIKPKGVFAPLTLGALWIILEWAQGYGPLAMNWGRLALSQYNFTPAIQSASLFGSLFITFLLICVNGLLALYLWNLFNHKTSKHSLYIAAAAIFLVNTCFGAIRIPVVNSSVKNISTTPIAAIQANFPSDEKWDALASDIFDAYYEITLDAIENGAKVIIWPETTVPISLESSSYLDLFRELADQYQVTFVIGAIHDNSDDSYNALYCIDTDNSDFQLYYKRQLVPFGEFIPFADFLSKFEVLRQFNLFEDMMTPGEEAIVFDTTNGKFSGLICFDSINQRFGYESVKKGAQVLFVATNDSWYIDTPSIHQHYGHAILRAVENNRFVARAANAGISGIISSTGKSIKSLASREEGYVLYDVPLIDSKTLYTRIGDSIAYVAIAGAAAAFIYFRIVEKILKRTKKEINQENKQ
jgi:apolipoprotein N-acyltransferase